MEPPTQPIPKADERVAELDQVAELQRRVRLQAVAIRELQAQLARSRHADAEDQDRLGSDLPRVDQENATLREALQEVEHLHAELVAQSDEVEQREAELRSIVEAFPAPMCVLDNDLDILRVNGAWRELAAIEESIYAGLGPGDSYYELLQLEFRQLGSNLVEHIYRLNLERFGTVNEVTPFLRHGRTHWVSVRARRVSEGDSGNIVVAHIDVTDRIEAAHEYKREHELLEIVLHNIPHAVYWKNRAGFYLGCNQAYVDLLGLNAPNEVIGRGASHAVVSPIEDFEEDVEVMLAGRPLLDQRKVVEVDGARRELVCSKVPMSNGRGQAEGVLAIYADLTDLNELERQLDRARRLEAIGQLSAGIAHEINTPMQYVGDNLYFVNMAAGMLLGLVDQLESESNTWGEDARTAVRDMLVKARIEPIRERLPEAIESAKEGVAAVSKIVTAMKGFAHPGGTEMKFASINDAIEATVAVARNEWKYVAELELDLAGDLPLVECDLAEINQVLLNMVINAAHAVAEKYADNGGMGRIQLSTESVDDRVVITIADDGMGIAEEHRERIFEQFFTTKEVGKGTGQGLAISLAVVERHHGTLLCNSTVGEGTTFQIVLPCKQPHDPSEAAT